MLGVRPVTDDDRWTMLDWRNSERVRAMSVADDVIDRATHAAWFDRLLAERHDEVLIVETDGAAVGVVSLERLDRRALVASWGCHLGVTEVGPGVGAALPMIGLGFGFGVHGLRRMTAEVLGDNRNMRGVHRRLGIPIEGTRRQAVTRSDGSFSDLVEYGVLRAEWPTIREAGCRLLPPSVRGDADRLLDALAAGALA